MDTTPENLLLNDALAAAQAHGLNIAPLQLERKAAELGADANLQLRFGGQKVQFLAGATARDLLLQYAHNIETGRETRDVDIALIFTKLWNYCNILRDDGMSYGDYPSVAQSMLCETLPTPQRERGNEG